MSKKRGALVKVSAKGIGKFAKPTSEAIGYAAETGKFLAQFIRAPLRQAVGILTDTLAYHRWERQHRLALRAQEFLKEKGLKAPTRPLPANIAIPLLTAATLEEDDDMQDVWARLLANAGDASEPEIKRAYVFILENMTPREARLLDALNRVPPEAAGADGEVWSPPLPDQIVTSKMMGELPHEQQERLPTPENHEALWNLVRLGCIAADAGWAAMGNVARWVAITPLGRAFIRACTVRPRSGV